MKRFASLIAIPAIAALGFVAVPAATGTSPGVHNGPLIHLTAAESPATSQPCEAGYSVWENAASGDLLLSPNVQNEDLTASLTAWSCWHFPDNGYTGQIKDEAGYCAEYHDSYVVSAACADIPAQEWYIGGDYCYSGEFVALNLWAQDYSPTYTYMNQSDNGVGDLINLAASCDAADNWLPTPVS
jgi:hypothetical protein